MSAPYKRTSLNCLSATPWLLIIPANWLVTGWTQTTYQLMVNTGITKYKAPPYYSGIYFCLLCLQMRKTVYLQKFLKGVQQHNRYELIIKCPIHQNWTQPFRSRRPHQILIWSCIPFLNVKYNHICVNVNGSYLAHSSDVSSVSFKPDVTLIKHHRRKAA